MGVHLGVCGFIPSHSFTFPGMWMWLWVAFSACTFPCPYLGHKPKAKVMAQNMCLAKKAIESRIIWTFESKTKLKDAFYHHSCNQCSKCLMLLDNNYNIFENVEIGGNCIFEKYLMKIKFSKYIKYLTNMCWNGQNIIHKYNHSTMTKKLQIGEKNHWAETKI
jgi:hypothetical protein